MAPRLRLALLLAVLLALFAVFWLGGVLDRERVEAWVEPFGPLAPAAYVVLAAGLGMALVPGPVLAAASGLLFGTLLGTGVTIAAAVLGSVLALLVARRTGAAGVRELSGPRGEALADALRRHGLLAVVVQRLAPGVPDAPCSYLAGLLGLRAWQIALGTLIGSAPRAFSYTALGDSLARPGSPLALLALAVLGATALAGTLLAARLIRRERGARVP